EIIRTYDCIYIEGYLIVNEPLFREALSLAKEAGLKVALDLSSFNVVESNLAMLQEVIPAYVDILFCNEQESFSFTGLSPREAASRLAQMVDIAVVTLGKEGALVATGNEVIPIDAVKALAVDTTGAGDHFAAGFLFGLSKSATLDRAARIGALLASHVVEVSGACIPDHQWEQIKLKVAHILN
nr:adenosine kinase [Parabacteroides sp.]